MRVHRSLRSSLIAWVAFATMALAAAEDSATTTPVRLADVGQCPDSPKPMCSDDNCQGATFVCATQFLCSSERHFAAAADDGRSLVLAGCRCCPLPLHVECTDHRCAAPEGTRVCVSEPLRGCACQRVQDRMEAMKAGAGLGWSLDDDFEVDFEPSSDEENGGNSSAPAVMPTMRLLSDHYWAIDAFGKLV